MKPRKAPESESVHCPMHDERSGYDYPSCSPDGCPFMQQAQLLEDRAVAIQFLVEGVLEGLRANSDEVTSLAVPVGRSRGRASTRTLHYRRCGPAPPRRGERSVGGAQSEDDDREARAPARSV